MKLIIEDDEGRKTVVPIVREEMEITIGRQEGNTIRLTERNVSRKHARISRKNGSVFVEDIGSSYGTRVNGDKIDGRLQVKEGDLIQIGDYDLAIQQEAGKQPAAAKSNGDADEGLQAPTMREMPAVPAPASSADEDDVESDPSKPARAPSKAQQTAVISGAQLKNLRPSRQVADIPEAQAPRLVLITTENAGREYACIRTELKIGRTDDNDIPLDHRSLSRNHCKVVREEDGTWKVIDLQSANGVKVNGESYADTVLRFGDTLELGHVKFKFAGPGDEVSLEEVGSRTASADAAARAHATKGKGLPKGALIGGGVGLLVLLAGGGFMLTRPSKPADDAAATPTEVAANTATPKAEPKKEPAPAAVPDEPEKTPEPDDTAAVVAAAETPKTVDPAAIAALEKGTRLVAAGKFAEAEKVLLEAEAGGVEGAAAELARAREGKSSTELLADAKKKLAGKDLMGARESLEQIPEESVIAEAATKVHEQLAAAEAKDAREQEALLARAAADEERKQKAEEEKAAREEKKRKEAEEKAARETKVATAPAVKKTAQPTAATKTADPEQAAADMTTGKDLLKKQKPKEAVTFFEKALAADPNAAESHMYLGSCYAMMGDLKKAAEHYEKFVRMRPDHKHAPIVRDNLRKYYEQYEGK